MTADSVVKWINYYKEKGTFAFNLATLDNVSATGPLEVTFALKTPDPLYPYYLDQEGQTGSIASDAATSDPEKMKTASYGAGPYVLDTTATVANSTYVYTKNPTYWNAKAQHWKKIVIKVFQDDNAALAAVRSGQVQVALGTATTAAAAKSAGLVVSSKKAGMTGIVINDRDGKIVPALKDQRVRQALNYAIDRDGLTKAVYKDFGAATMQYKPADTDGYVAASDKTYAYDPSKAKQLLAEAGASDLSFDVLVQPGVPGGTLLAQAIEQQWSAVGVKINLVTSPTFGDYVAKALSGKYVATTYVYYYQPLIWELNELFSPTGIYNFLGAVTPGLDDLRAKINQQEVGSDAANASEQEAMKLVVDQALSVPVSAIDTILYSAKNISGVDFTPAFPIPDPSQWYSVSS